MFRANMRQANGQLRTIGEAADAVGVAPTTLRYYERAGILRCTQRSEGGYRLYDAEALRRLRFIRAAQAAGFSLDDVRTLVELERDDVPSCRTRVQRLIDRRLAEIDRRMNDLKNVRRTLVRALRRCRRSRGKCAVIEDLSADNLQRRRQ